MGTESEGFAPGLELELGSPPPPRGLFRIGVQDGWHAIDPAGIALRCELHARAVCGAVVRVTKHEQPYDPAAHPVSIDPCPACRWIVAARTETLDAALAALDDAIALTAATDVLNAARRDEREPDDPRTIQLLAAISRHAPVPLVAENCSEGDCGHPAGMCPESMACAACSLQAGDWAGEWQGQYLGECTIGAPCSVLLRLAEAARAEVAQ
jgi:hypothetical protein